MRCSWPGWRGGGSGLLQLPDLSVISTPFRQDSHSTRQFGLFGERVIALHHQKKSRKGSQHTEGTTQKSLSIFSFIPIKAHWCCYFSQMKNTEVQTLRALRMRGPLIDGLDYEYAYKRGIHTLVARGVWPPPQDGHCRMVCSHRELHPVVLPVAQPDLPSQSSHMIWAFSKPINRTFATKYPLQIAFWNDKICRGEQVATRILRPASERQFLLSGNQLGMAK